MSPQPPRNIVRLSAAFYLPMMASGAFMRPPGTIRVDDPGRLLMGLAAALLIGLLVVGLSRFAARGTGWGRALHSEFHSVLGALDSRQILLLALLSGFGEELLFRGVLYPRLGLIGSALLFAVLHFPYRKTLIPWSVFALVLGVVLGVLTGASGSLWPAIFLHFFINYYNLHDLTGDSPLTPDN